MSFQRLFDVCATSNRRWNDVVCLQERGFILCHRRSLGRPSWFEPISKWSLKFIPLKVHQLSPYSCLASSSRLSWKRIWLLSAEGYFSRILHKAHEGITFLNPLPSLLWIYYENCLFTANLYDVNSDKHKISYSSFVNFIDLQT